MLPCAALTTLTAAGRRIEGRKYLPSRGPDGLNFTLTPAHKALQRLMLHLISSVEASQQGELSQLDLSAWQK